MATSTPIRPVSPDRAREVLMQWLQPYTENGSMDALYEAFVTQLAPYAAQIANRILQGRFPTQPSDELVVERLRISLRQFLQVLEHVGENEAAMLACGYDTARSVVEAQRGLRDWLRFLESWPASSPEAAVPPATESMMATGGVP